MTREKVMAGLECLTHVDFAVYKSECEKRDCPYKDTDCEIAVMKDAYNLLKAQEPRVMTLDEIGNALKMPLWKETKRAHKDLYIGWVLAYDIQKGLGITGTRLGMSEPSGRVVWYSLDDYGKTWRCWTSRPTDEVRRATPWE